MNFHIYLIIHYATGLSYVGMTKHDYLVRWNDHVVAAKYSVKTGKTSPMLITRYLVKYGVDAFVVLLIAQAFGIENAKKLERYFIDYYSTRSPQGLNLTMGGDGIWGYKFTSEQLIRLRESHLGKGRHKKTLEQRAAISARNKGQKPNAYALGAKPASTREKLSQAMRGRKPSEKTIEAVRLSGHRRKGEKRKPYPKSHSINVSRALLGRVQSKVEIEKRANSNRGKKRSIEFRNGCRERILARLASGWKPSRKTPSKPS